MTDTNPSHLYRLAELRQNADLSLQQAARYFQLSPKNGRKTVSAWEIGDAVPRTRRRPQFLRYLWDGLGLKRDQQQFRDIWEILVDEWEWDPLTPDEVNGLKKQEDVEEPGSVPDLNDVENDDEPPTQHRLPGWARWGFIPFALILSIGFVVRIRSVQNPEARLTVTPPAIVTFPAIMPTTTLPPATSTVVPINNVELELGFEHEDDLQKWVIRGGEDCKLDSVAADDAHEGSGYARLARLNGACESIFHDIDVPPTTNSHARFGIYLRNGVEGGSQVGVTLWADGPEMTRDTVTNVGRPVVVFDSEWSCIEVLMPIDATQITQIRAEIYVNEQSIGPLLLDSAKIVFDGPPLCPESDLQGLLNADFEDASQPVGWLLDALPCEYEIVRDADFAKSGNRYLRMQRNNNYCHLLYQDLVVPPGTIVNIAVWVRSESDDSVQGRLGLTPADEWHKGEEMRFDAMQSAWICVEKTLVASSGAPTLLRPTLYHDSTGGTLAVDRFVLHFGDESVCPDVTAFKNSDFEDANTI